MSVGYYIDNQTTGTLWTNAGVKILIFCFVCMFQICFDVPYLQTSKYYADSVCVYNNNVFYTRAGNESVGLGSNESPKVDESNRSWVNVRFQ